ncbi:MAG TPA: 4-hydroxy-3-methylbut-2-enyl diphosphate reductase [Chitinophagales bacterium]|nr:4-hydroxy-3-methylbut-2-enyl diphosphate reductase [Chitinophagales bacterium]
MQVTIDQNSGFCFGVVYAIQMAEDELDSSHELYCLGDIVHNDIEVKRLGAKGLKIINHEDLKKLHDCKVLIRAHGEPPQTYITALENNIELLDASCPVVLKLQNRVKLGYDKLLEKNAQVVIYGIPGHAEVNGLMGQTNQKAIIITSEEDLHKLDFSRPIVLFSQTTKSTEKFYHLAELISQRAAAMNNSEVSVNDTICRQVSNREPQLQKFSALHDVIVFVSGKKSSNGKVLYQVCKAVNPRSYFVSDENELEDSWFENASSVGICGATSTPLWLMEQVQKAIEEKFSAEVVVE